MMQKLIMWKGYQIGEWLYECKYFDSLGIYIWCAETNCTYPLFTCISVHYSVWDFSMCAIHLHLYVTKLRIILDSAPG